MKPIRILLIDDELSSRQGIADYLRDVSEFEVVEFESGREAISHLEKNWDTFTAVLLDFVLDPDMPGEFVLEKIRSQYPRLPVIVFTGRDPAGSIQTLGLGAYARMQRPFNYTELVNIIRSLAELEAVFMQMAADVIGLLNSDVCFAWRLDRKAHLFHVAGWAGNADSKYCQTVTLSSSDQEWQKFLAKGKPLLLPDVMNPAKAPRYRHRDMAAERGWKSLITIPLVHQQRVIGLIDSYTYTPFAFRNQDHKKMTIGMLGAFAHQAAEAVRFTDLSQQTHALQEINQTLADTLEEKTILKSILYKAVELVGADFGWLYMFEPNKGVLCLKETEGVKKSGLDDERNLGEGITGWVAVEGTAYKVDDVSSEVNDPRKPKHLPTQNLDVNSEVAVPLRRGARTIGVLTVKSRLVNYFTDDDTKLLMSLAAFASVAIERAKLAEHLQEVSHLALLVTRFTELAEYVVEAVRDLTGADVNLWMMSQRENEGDNWMRIVASKGKFSDEYIKNTKLPTAPYSCINAQSLHEQKPIIKRDLLDDVEESGFFYIDQAREHNWHAFMAIPMLGRENEPIGVLSLYSNVIGRFDSSEGQLMQTFANQAAVAFQQQKRVIAMQQLAEVGQTLSVGLSEAKELLNQVADLACHIMGASCTAIYPYDPIKQRFYEKRAVAVVGIRNSQKDITDKPRNKGLAAFVRQYKEIIVHDIDNGDLEIDSDASTQLNVDKELIVSIIKNENFIQRENVKAFIGVSLQARKRNGDKEPQEVGILYINYRAPHHFTEEELQIVRIYAYQVANVIRNARLYTETQRRLNLQQSLYETGINMTRQLDMKEVAELILEELGKVVEYHKANIQVIHGDKRELVAFRGFDDGREDQRLHRLISKDRLITRIVTSKKPIILRHARKSSNWEILPGTEDVHSWVGLPLVYGKDVIGLMTLDHKQAGFYTNDFRDLLILFANQAAVSIQNALLFKELQRRQNAQITAIREITGAMTARANLDTLLEGVLDSILSLIDGAILAELLELNDTKNELVVKAERGSILGEWNRRVPVSKGIVGWVTKNNKLLYVSDVKKDDRYLQILENTRSEIALPIRKDNELIGVLNIEHPQLNGFSEKDYRLAEAMAGLVSVAIENVRLLNRIADRANRLADLQGVTRDISAEPFNVDGVLNRIVNSLSRIFGNVPCLVRLYDSTNREFTQAAIVKHTNILPDIAQTIAGHKPRPNGTSQHVINVKTAYFIKDTQKSPSDGLSVHPTFIEHGVQALAIQPIISDQKVIGILYLPLEKPHTFSENEKRILELFAHQAAVVIKNAQFRENEVNALKEIATSVAIGEYVKPEKMLQNIIDITESFLGRASLFAVRLLDNDKKELYLSAFKGIRDEAFPERVQVGEGITGWVAKHNEPQLIQNVRKDERYLPGRKDARSELSVPISGKNGVVGVFSIESPNEQVFTETDVRFAEAIAGVMAVALDNLRLYEEMNQELLAYKVKVKTAEQVIMVDNFMVDILHNIPNLVGTIPARSETIIHRLQKKGNLTVEEEKSLDQLQGIARDAEEVLKSIKQWKPIEDIQKETSINVGVALNSALRSVSMPGNIVIILSIMDDLPKVWCNPRELRESFRTVIANAVQAMEPKGGNLTISAVPKHKRDKIWVKILITDTGRGIHPKNSSRIFDLFYTIKDNETSWGYGLWRSRSIIEMIGGTIQLVRSQVGIGSVFKIMLPGFESSYNDIVG